MAGSGSGSGWAWFSWLVGWLVFLVGGLGCEFGFSWFVWGLCSLFWWLVGGLCLLWVSVLQDRLFWRCPLAVSSPTEIFLSSFEFLAISRVHLTGLFG